MSAPSGPPTRTQPAAPQPPPPSRGGDLDLKTLVITAIASAAAAFICSKVWAPGTLASAAFTPVAVAIFREALRKPTDAVTTALPAALPMSRRGPVTSGPARPDDPTRAFDAVGGEDHTRVRDVAGVDPTRVHDVAGVDPTRVHAAGGEPTRVSPVAGPQGPGAVGAEPVSVHAVRPAPGRRRWWIAGGTGLLGFVIAAVLITVPEVVAGKERTTIFRESRDSRAPVATTTQQAPSTTVIQQITTVAPETVTMTTTVPTTTTTETRTVTRQAPATTTSTRTATTPTTTTLEETPEDAPGAEALP